jgi:hypothetical protein
MAYSRIESVTRWFLVLLLLVAPACEPQKGSTLDNVEAKMRSVVGRVPLGDRASFTFDPLYQADWFLLVPANANAGMFEEAQLGKALDPIPGELLGRPEPVMATIDGKEVDVRELPFAFQVTKVMGKRGKNTHGIRFVRLGGSGRNYVIQQID